MSQRISSKCFRLVAAGAAAVWASGCVTLETPAESDARLRQEQLRNIQVARLSSQGEQRSQEVAALKLVVAQQAELIREMQARLGLNSRNSSKPPSSDPPATPPAPRSKPTGRKQGGQPGHHGASREPFPPADVGEFVEVQPSHCQDCATPLRTDSAQGLVPARHQTV